MYLILWQLVKRCAALQITVLRVRFLGFVIITVLLVYRLFVCFKARIETPRSECFYVENYVLSVYVLLVKKTSLLFSSKPPLSDYVY